MCRQRRFRSLTSQGHLSAYVFLSGPRIPQFSVRNVKEAWLRPGTLNDPELQTIKLTLQHNCIGTIATLLDVGCGRKLGVPWQVKELK